jgi:hypothetical protein
MYTPVVHFFIYFLFGILFIYLFFYYYYFWKCCDGDKVFFTYQLKLRTRHAKCQCNYINTVTWRLIICLQSLSRCTLFPNFPHLVQYNDLFSVLEYYRKLEIKHRNRSKRLHAFTVSFRIPLNFSIHVL